MIFIYNWLLIKQSIWTSHLFHRYAGTHLLCCKAGIMQTVKQHVRTIKNAYVCVRDLWGSLQGKGHLFSEHV